MLEGDDDELVGFSRGTEDAIQDAIQDARSGSGFRGLSWEDVILQMPYPIHVPASDLWSYKWYYYSTYLQSYKWTYHIITVKKNMLIEFTQKQALAKLSYYYKNCDMGVFRIISEMITKKCT